MSDSRLLPTGSSPLEILPQKPVRKLKKRRSGFVNCGPGHLPGKSAAVAGVGVFGRRWDEKWPEATKRAVIRDAYFSTVIRALSVQSGVWWSRWAIHQRDGVVGNQ